MFERGTRRRQRGHRDPPAGAPHRSDWSGPEPQRLIFQALCTALTLNGLANVWAYQAAVGSRVGNVHLPVVDPSAPRNYGAMSVRPDESPGERVALLTIDALELPRCNLVKSDTEGWIMRFSAAQPAPWLALCELLC